MIPWDSQHHISHKLAALNSFFHRLFSIPLSTVHFTLEKNIIFQMALNNGFPLHVINKVFNKKNRQRFSENCYVKYVNKEKLSNKSFISLPFLGHISVTCARALKSLNKNLFISFKSSNTISSMFSHLKDKVNDLNKSGVYKLQCGSCTAEYVGQTGRTFDKRIKEHLRSQRLIHDNKSSFGTHLKAENHSFDPATNFKVLQTHNKSLKLNVLENIEIAVSQSIPNRVSLNEPCSNIFRTYARLISYFK